MRRVEADGGSGTWRGMPVQRGQGALMEGDTDMSSPPLGGSVDSMVSPLAMP